MEKYFVSYEQGLALKELGFDEPCWCYFITPFGVGEGIFNDSMFLKDYEYLDTMPKHSTYILAPLKSQVFDWFREKYELWFRPDYYDEIREYDYQGSIHRLGKFGSITSLGNHKTVEELESACIDKLIEIVKSYGKLNQTN